MRYSIISIFPEFFDSFVSTSLIAKAQEVGRITIDVINPRDFCADKHQQIDDMPYGGGAGMLMKAQPVIDAIRSVTHDDTGVVVGKPKIVLVGPSKNIFDQTLAHHVVDIYSHCIFICGRYEGIDDRVREWCEKTFGENFSVWSIGKFVTLGGEVPTMAMIEATARLLPGVIKEELSRQDESYRPELGGENIEYPQYTRPEEVEGLHVPEILLSGHHARIQERRKKHSQD